MKQVGERRPLPPALLTPNGIQVYPLQVVAERVSLSPKRIVRLAKAQKIIAVKPSTEWFVSLDDVLDWEGSSHRIPRSIVKKAEEEAYREYHRDRFEAQQRGEGPSFKNEHKPTTI